MMNSITDTPSPPRVKHAAGPSRYEKEVMNMGEQREETGPKAIGEWRLGKTVGKGASGQVKIAKSMRTGQYAAVKIVPRHIMVASAQRYDHPDPITRRKMRDREERREERQRLTLEREIVIMKLIDHPNVISLLDVHEKDGMIYLVLEYVQGGELFEYLVSSRSFEANEASKYFQQIIRGLDYCHRFGICHRDLKPENIMLTAEKNIKIADFGMAAWQGSNQMLETSCGSPHYASPEIVKGQSYHGAASDIWSCGVILYALLAGTLPFDDKDMQKLLTKVGKGRYAMPPNIPLDAQDLIERMLVVDPLRRITMREIMSHPFFYRQHPTQIAHPVPIVDPPKLEVLSQSLKSRDLIDEEILDNLCALWKGHGRTRIIDSLLGNEKCYEKVFYFLLDKHRKKRLEDFNEPAQVSKQDRDHKIKRKPSAVDVFLANTKGPSGGSGHLTRQRTRSASGTAQSTPLREVHRAAPQPFFKRNNPTAGPDIGRDFTTSTPSPVPHLQDQRPTSWVGHPDQSDARQKAESLKIETSAQQPVSAPAETPDFFSHSGPADSSAEEINFQFENAAVESPTPISRRPQIKKGHSMVPKLPPIRVEIAPPSSETLAVEVDMYPSPMLSPALPDDQYRDIFEKANPEGNPELAAFLSAIAFHVTAFRQFGTPLPLFPYSPVASGGGFQAQQEERMRETSAEQDFPPTIDTPRLEDEADGSSWSRPADGQRGESHSACNYEHQRHASASTAATPCTESVERIEILTDQESVPAVEDLPPPVLTKKRSLLRRNSRLNDGTATPQANATPRQRSKSAFDKALDFRTKKNHATAAESSGSSGQVGIEYIAPPIASPFASGIETESKTGFLKGIRFSWKALRKVLVSQRDATTVLDECVRMLQSFRVQVDMVNTDPSAYLKCKVDSFKDPSTGIIYEKHLRFRVDVRVIASETSQSSEAPWPPCQITFTQEKGSATIFNAIIERFCSEWFLDKLQRIE